MLCPVMPVSVRPFKAGSGYVILVQVRLSLGEVMT
jgi:hypothetical protein